MVHHQSSAEHRFSGILTAVTFAGVVALRILGDYSYFGIVDTDLPLAQYGCQSLPARCATLAPCSARSEAYQVS